MVQGYMLSRLDELKAICLQTATKVEELQTLLQSLPAAAVEETTSQSLLSRLQNWLPLLQQLGGMVIKHIITVTMIYYMVKEGGSSLTAAEMLLKLL